MEEKVQKKLRNTDSEYINSSGKMMQAKVFNSSAQCCKKDCVGKITVEERKAIHDSFWPLGNHSAQTAYIAGCIEQSQVATKTTASGTIAQTSQKRKSFGKDFSRKYTLATSDRRVSVCKKNVS